MVSAEGPSAAACVHLDEREASQIWRSVLARQGLSEWTKLPSVDAIAEAALGLHAARLPTPFATVATRSATPDVPLTLLCEHPNPGLRTVRCMRKTLHVLPSPLARIAHLATVHYRVRDVLRLLRNAGVELAAAERGIRCMTSHLRSSGHASPRAIEEFLISAGYDVPAARLALKLAWERGDLIYHNATSAWDREVRTFRLDDRAAAAVDGSPAVRETATNRLLGLYFSCYGPATVRDAAWWSGLSQGTVVSALRLLDVVVLRLPWATSPFYMLRQRLEQFLATRAPEVTDVNFLAHEDVALKAYHESRSRYLGGLQQRQVFNQIGEILPTVVVNGRVIGRWSWDRAERRIHYRSFPAAASRRLHGVIEARSRELGRVLAQGCSGRA